MAETTASNAAASAPSWAADLAWQPSGSKFPAVDGHDSDAFHGACGSSADASHTSSQLHCGSHLQHETSPHRPSGGIVGSRKRKAYRPRNSGLDEEPIVEDCAPPPAHPYVPKAQNTVVKPSHASHKRAGSHTDSDDQHVPTRTSKRQRSASAAATSLAATRPRRAAKPRAHFDPDAFDLSSGDADGGDVCAAAATSASDDEVHFSHLAQHRHSSKGAAPHACASAVAALADHAPASAAVDEQRMFQEFRKRTCTAYTGVVVHCQNMKLEARVNMVSYLPDRERKIGGGQLYIAYMTNPHQAAIVHDITASIMTADGIPIYHNQNRRPSVNREVALERLNYLDTLEINTRRCAPLSHLVGICLPVPRLCQRCHSSLAAERHSAGRHLLISEEESIFIEYDRRAAEFVQRVQERDAGRRGACRGALHAERGGAAARAACVGAPRLPLAHFPLVARGVWLRMTHDNFTATVPVSLSVSAHCAAMSCLHGC